MRTPLALLTTCLLAATARAGGPDTSAFDRSFVDATLRVDYLHGGDAEAESASWDRSIRQGTWAGSRVHLIDPFEVGRTLVEVRDPSTGEVLFSRRGDSYYGEYRTTNDARAGFARMYHASALVPFPKRKVEVVVSVRQKDRGHKVLLKVPVDPSTAGTTVGSVALERPRAGVKVVEGLRSGDPHEMVDVAIVAEGYAEGEEAKFRRDLARFAETLFSQEPFRSSRGRFNLWGVFAASAESGCDEPGRGSWRQTALGLRFDSLGSERYLLTEENRDLRDIAANAPYDVIYVMANTSRYGGGGIYNLFCTFTSDNQWSPYVFLHEFGHTFAALADEYYSSNVAYNDFFPRGIEPIEPNVTALLDPKALKWSALASPGIEVPTPWAKPDFDRLDEAFQKDRERINKAIDAASRANPAKTAEVDRLKVEADTLSRDHAARMDAALDTSPLKGKVGAFEGAGYTSKGLYRPSLDCIMFSKGTKPFCAVCDRAVARMIDYHGEGPIRP